MPTAAFPARQLSDDPAERCERIVAAVRRLLAFPGGAHIGYIVDRRGVPWPELQSRFTLAVGGVAGSYS